MTTAGRMAYSARRFVASTDGCQREGEDSGRFHGHVAGKSFGFPQCRWVVDQTTEPGEQSTAGRGQTMVTQMSGIATVAQLESILRDGCPRAAHRLRMGAAFVALVLALAAPAASQPRLAEFDLEALEAARVEIGETGRVRIELPRPVAFGIPVILDATGPTSAGYYLTGELEGLPDWPVKLVVHGEVVAAAVHWYTWRSGEGGSAADAPSSRSPAAFEPWGNDAVMAPRRARALRLTAEDAAGPEDAAAPMEDGSWIDLLVFYTPEAKQEDADGDAAIMELLVDLLIVHTNAVYAESGVAHRLRLAAQPIEAEPFREAGFDSSSEMLRRLVDWERGRELRDRYAADLVTLLFRGKGLADAYSRAWINLPDRVTADEAWPFSVTCSNCVRAFPHEIGHNLGLRHDRYEWKQGETPDYLLIDAPHPEAFGFAGPIDGDPDTDCIVTVMATGLECVEDGFLQVVRFSNPERETRGIATGIPGTEPSGEADGPANAARHMNRMRRYAANWRRAPCLSGGSSVRLQASSGRYVAAVGNGGGAVRADQRRLWPRGLFTLVDHNGGPCVESGDSVSLHTSDGFYLQAQLGGGATVDATARQAAPWTRFVVRRQLGSGALRDGDTLSLHTTSGHWVVAAQGGGGEVRADSEDPSRPWSRFKVAALWRDPPPRPNRPPAAVSTLPDRQLPPGAQLEVEVAGVFRDADGDPLTYTAASSAPGVVTVSAAGNGVTLTAVSEGTATIRVTATDPGGLSATQAFTVTVSQPANRPPETVGTLPALTIGVDEPAATVEVSGAFRDPDGDTLTYGASSSSPSVASVSVVGSGVTVTPLSEGTSLVAVTATDIDGSNTAATQSFTVTVRPPANRPPETVGTLSPLTIEVGQPARTVKVGGAFRDPDGDTLAYRASTSAPSVASVSLSASRVTVTPVSEGSALVTVTATDIDGSNTTTTQSFTVTVRRPFTDHPIVPGETPVRAVHFTELRTRIDALRSAAGEGPFAWTDPVLQPGVTPVRLVHLSELRSALGAAYAAAGRPAPRWSDASPVGGTTAIRAAHLMELRAAVVALE